MSTIKSQLRAFQSRPQDILNVLMSGTGDRPTGTLVEGDDTYAHVVARLHPRYRVVLSKHGGQWVLQKRQVAVGACSRTAWRKHSLATTRVELIAAVDALRLHVDPSIMETLNALPENAALCPSPNGLPQDLGAMTTPDASGASSLAQMMDTRRTIFRMRGETVQGSTKESDDHYRNGVCRLNDGWRVILTKDGSQFALQRRAGKTAGGRARWNSRSFCTSKVVLLRDITRFAGHADPLAHMVLNGLPGDATGVCLRP